MKKGTIAWILAAAVVLIIIFTNTSKDTGMKVPLLCHVGGTMTPVMERITKLYEAETGQPVDINAAGSGELLAYIQGQQKGDLYICHDPFIDILMQKWKIGVDGWQIAELTPVIVVQKGNPLNIRDLKDLARDDVRLILTDYKLSSLGWMLPTIFSKAGIDFEQLNKQKKIITNKSGGYAANFVKMNNADASMVWNAVWKLREDALDCIPVTPYLPVPHVDAVTSATEKSYTLTPLRVTAATLKCSAQPEAARKFAEFLASDKVDLLFKEYGFTMGAKDMLYKDGTVLTEKGMPVESKSDGRVTILCAAGMRRAMDHIFVSFKEKTGINIDPDYGGSGIILARASITKDVDLFMPGDQWYVDKLQENTGKVVAQKHIAFFIPVLITQKGNPKKITGLKDFFREDLRVGIGEAKSCQVGQLTARIMEKNGFDPSKIVAKESTTVNELGVWVRMNNVDVSLVWDAIANNLKEDVDIIEIPKEQSIISKVTISLLNTSQNTESARKFMDYLTSEEARQILEKNGYKTVLDE